ncbi:unnamed protein product [Oppiella nova]|uniref:Nuclear speckle splicing regulatory protein 1 N-terminal domain-containing protein n=1 Tax=Oppiella nova TaxID=334625 RepID=A0A7R9M8T3_9ACAR|nr:unnamed protein product [Oppiella nova]CAG2172608.1 unnamed protein product [Oppiella nova]
MADKKYGLIRLSKANKPVTTLKKNIFDSDSDDEDAPQASTKKPVNTSSGLKRQTQLDISRALTEDPNVFEYDSIYEDMKSKSESITETDPQNAEKPKAKYINNLLKFSENRKKETERRTERKIQKEREREGNEFEDKEQFVTNAYKEKLQELRAQELRDQKEQQIEELLDVKKQQDLSGFYRHLLNRDMTGQSNPSVAETPQELPKEVPKEISKPKTSRQFRRRRSSSEESEESPHNVETTAVKNENKSENKSQTEVKAEASDGEDDDESIDSNPDADAESEVKPTKPTVGSNDENNSAVTEKTETTEPKVDKRELLLQKFTKRTVGEVFSSAQMRYFERKNKYVI